MEYYDSYIRWTSTKSDDGTTIQRRHEFFADKMLLFINPLKKADRNFTIAEKEIMYYRDRQMCQVCKMKGDSSRVAWDDAEFHHVKPHSEGGKSTVDNGALVHKKCHPMKKEDVKSFHEWWIDKNQDSVESLASMKKFPPPEGTECRFNHQGDDYFGTIKNKKLVVTDIGVFNSFSSASCEVTDTSRNGWHDWELILPGQSEWLLADEWRKHDV